jgi:hypothetical protein
LTPAPLVRQWRIAVACVTIRAGPKEESMAKGQMRSSKEAKKPKSDKTKNSVSEYKKSLAAGGHNVPPPSKKS